MAFESALFRPSSGSYDRDAVIAHLRALPYAFLDPIGGVKFHLSATISEAHRNRAARIADPSRFPYGVLVELRPDGVLIDQANIRDALARGRQFVLWLMGQGRWSVVTERGDLGVLTGPDALYPEPLPDPASLVDDLLSSPPPFGILWTWRDGADTLQIHESGRLRLERQGHPPIEGQLTEDATERWRVLAEPIDPDMIDGDADDPEQTASLYRETPDEDASLYYDRRRIPDEVAPVLELLGIWARAMIAWQPGTALPESFAALG